ncbi:hypothetical protein [Bradyrhizobium sp. 187]|uniref:hypothetical protein n=1 Tax=Bradyrhizobium sp. 187 TaxID=2782655 RepID=UPI001FFE909C|nr:hypothetical protein [Bradyrhizobium sp. 187]UPJ72798.1 hypothetical protein IVB19_35570 [Bradyrhizobium sp. 187]
MFDAPLVPTSVGAEIADLKLFTAQSWVKKRWLLLKRRESDQPSSGRGATALLSPRRVLQMAVAARLVELGMSPKAACNAALQFTDRSNPLEAPGFERAPGELYGGGALTALCAYPDGTAAVVRADRKNTPFEQVFFPIGSASVAGSGRKEGAIVLLLDFIVKGVAEQFAGLAERGEI